MVTIISFTTINYTTQKMDKSVMENFMFRAVLAIKSQKIKMNNSTNALKTILYTVHKRSTRNHHQISPLILNEFKQIN